MAERNVDQGLSHAINVPPKKVFRGIIDLDNVPPELIAEKRWVACQYQGDDKIPYWLPKEGSQILGGAKPYLMYASPSNTWTWNAFEDANNLINHSIRFHALQFALTEHPSLVLFDFDNVFAKKDTLTEWVDDLIARFPSFYEYSKNGIHGWGRMEGADLIEPFKLYGPNGEKLEVFTGHTARFATVTGRLFRRSPIADCTDFMRYLQSMFDRLDIELLFHNGDGYPHDYDDLKNDIDLLEAMTQKADGSDNSTFKVVRGLRQKGFSVQQMMTLSKEGNWEVSERQIDQCLRTLQRHPRTRWIPVGSHQYTPPALHYEKANLLLPDDQRMFKTGRIVKPLYIDGIDSWGKATKTPSLYPLPNELIRSNMEISATAVKRTKRGWSKEQPPPQVAKLIEARVRSGEIEPIRGLMSVPLLRPDGSIGRSRPGYDPETQCFLMGLPRMPDGWEGMPTKDDGYLAAAELKKLLSGFAYVDDDGVSLVSHFDAMGATLVRHLFPCKPGSLFTATEFRVGKTFAAQLAIYLKDGRLGIPQEWDATAHENESRLDSAIGSGLASIFIDNANGPFDSKTLSIILTSVSKAVREMKQNRQLTIVDYLVSVFITGHQSVVSDELSEKICVCWQDAGEVPGRRRFEFNPLDLLRADRGHYVNLFFQMYRPYLAAGCPTAIYPRIAGFEGWSDISRSMWKWYDMADPAQSMQISKDKAPQKVAIRAIRDAWKLAPGYGQRLSVADLIEGSKWSEQLVSGYPTRMPPRLGEAMEPALRLIPGWPNHQKIGDFLSSWGDRIIDGVRFCICTMLNGRPTYTFAELGHEPEFWKQWREREAPLDL